MGEKERYWAEAKRKELASGAAVVICCLGGLTDATVTEWGG